MAAARSLNKDLSYHNNADFETNTPVVVPRCFAFSTTCPIWSLDKFIVKCNDETSKKLVMCGYAGDDVLATYQVVATKLHGVTSYLTGSVTLYNNSLGPVSVTGVTVVAIDITTNVPTEFQALVEPTFLGTFLPSTNQTTTVLSYIPAAYLCKSSFVIKVSYTDANAVSSSLTVPIVVDCAHFDCKCNETNLRVIDTQYNGPNSSVVIDDIPYDAVGPVMATYDGPKIAIGNVVNNTASCSGQSVTTNTATLQPKPTSAPSCGSMVCPATDTATIVVDCVVPVLTAVASLITTTAEDWCVCKNGEIIAPCVTPPITGCTHSQGYYKTHGPKSDCADCTNGSGINDYPKSVQDNGLMVVGLPASSPSISQQMVCALLQLSINSNDTSSVKCVAGTHTTQVLSWKPFVEPIHQYIAFLLNIAKLGGVPPCAQSLYDKAVLAFKPFFATFNGVVFTAFDTVATSVLDSLLVTAVASDLGLFNSSIYPPCTGIIAHCQDPVVASKASLETSHEICCPEPYVKWTIDLSKSVTVTSTSSLSVTVTIAGCTVPYEKIFDITATSTNGGLPLSGMVSIAAGTSSGTVTFPGPFANGVMYTINASYDRAVYSTKSCTTPSSGGKVILAPVPVTFAEKCVTSTASLLSDVVSFPDCSSTMDKITLPSCDDTKNDACHIAIRNNTTVTVSSSSKILPCSASPPVTVGLCEAIRGDILRMLLDSLVAKQQTIDPNSFFVLAGVDAGLSCSSLHCYDSITLVFYTPIPPCSCSVRNVAKVTTTNALVMPCVDGNFTSHISESDIILATGKTGCVTANDSALELMQTTLRRAPVPMMRRKK